MSAFDAENSTGSDTAGDNRERASVAVHNMPNAVVLTVAGEIDMTTASALERAVRQSLAQHPATLIIDLTGAQFFSSAGIAVLVLAHRQSNDTALRVVAADRVVLRPLELTGLADDLAIRTTVEAALAG
ncbi:MAG TPA: STAS domain-containing protein [Pseudonocardiaceae bacterium]|jgi:anti-anti-sigma factor